MLLIFMFQIAASGLGNLNVPRFGKFISIFSSTLVKCYLKYINTVDSKIDRFTEIFQKTWRIRAIISTRENKKGIVYYTPLPQTCRGI